MSPAASVKQRLAGARLAEQRDEIDVRIHEEIEGEALFAVARRDAPDVVLLMRVVLERLQHGGAPGDLLDQHIERLLAGLLLVEELVDEERGDERSRDPVVRVPTLLPRLHALAVPVPEIRRQLAHPAVEEIGVLQHLVVEIVFRGDAERTRLDPHVDVFRHQDHAALGVQMLQVHHDREDLVVGLAVRERGGQHGGDDFGLQVQPPGGGAAGLHRQRNAFDDAVRHRGDELVEEARSLPRIARDFGDAFLVVVELLEREDGEVDVVFLEPEQARGVVHQDVGVEDEQLAGGDEAGGGAGFGRGFAGLAGDEG